MKKLILIIMIFFSYVTYAMAEDFGVYCGHHDGVSNISVAANESVAFAYWTNAKSKKSVAFKIKTKKEDLFEYEASVSYNPGVYHLSVSRKASFVTTEFVSGKVSNRVHFSQNCRMLNKDEVSKLMAKGGN